LKKIGILTFWEFPEGMAPTNRILAYGKGLVENGAIVEIYSFRRIFKDEVNEQSITMAGEIFGISYRYLHVFNSLGRKYKLIRIFDELLLRFKVFYRVFKSNSYKKFDFFLFSFDDLNSLATYNFIFKFFTFPIIFIADEYPIPIRDFMKDEVPNEMLVKYKQYHKFFKGRILMTEALESFYNNFISKKPSFILNTIIDTERFDRVQCNSNNVRPYICYMGNMSLKKDDIITIIYAFSKVNKYFPEIELHLYGTPNSEDAFKIYNLIVSLNLSSRIYLKGKASFQSVPLILVNSTILVNAQPITKRAQGGFPTKLGEYLLSKKPSVFTDSGDISKFIIHKHHAFIVQPENPDEYANILLFILNNYELALNVAISGEALIRSSFSAKQQSKLMLNFFDEIELKA